MSEHLPWSALTAPLLPVTMRGRPRQSWLDWKLASMMPAAATRGHYSPVLYEHVLEANLESLALLGGNPPPCAVAVMF